MTDTKNTCRAFCEYLAKEKQKFILLDIDGNRVTFISNIEEEMTAESLLPNIMCSLMESNISFAKLVLFGTAIYTERHGELLDLLGQEEGDEDDE